MERDRATRTYWIFILIPLAVLTAFYFYPLAKVLWLSVTVPSPGFGNYEKLLSSTAIHNIMLTTLRICIITTALSLVIGYAIAYAMLQAPPERRVWMLFIVLLSFWLSVLVRGFAWLTLLQSRGLVNTALMGMGLIDAPLPLVRNELGVVIGMVHYLIPYAVLPIFANMQGIDSRLVPAARGLGASRFTAFWRVFLPLSMPGIISAGILLFIFSLGFYITPALLGGGKTVMIAEYIAVQIMEALNWGTGSMLAVTLLVGVIALLAAVSRFANLREVFGAKS
ncbi:ABC transporter permease [Vineibacter terrae]|uniref:ABC transporter permease n=1 Tax=Vineibacter terrae TaxID=2586908 RepID=UPI002E2F3AF0|nr:ABC transporter permease [Vineibacter terrae]HEX2887736.1 ABC transporter permease [Vineibacter terrae]